MKNRQKATPVFKPTMNLAFKEKKVNIVVLIPALAAILLLAALVGKYGVADRLARVDALRAEVGQMHMQIRQLQDAYSDYDEVQKEYNRYTYRGFDKTIWDRNDVLNLLETEIMPVCTLRTLSVSGKQLNISVGGLTLEGVSRLLNSLEKNEMVNSVEVPSFTAMDERTVAESLEILITLNNTNTGGES